jgi:hypothetical protein
MLLGLSFSKLQIHTGYSEATERTATDGEYPGSMESKHHASQAFEGSALYLAMRTQVVAASPGGSRQYQALGESTLPPSEHYQNMPETLRVGGQ